MIVIVAKNRLKPGKKEAFLHAVRTLIEKSRQESGNSSYDLFEDIADENTVSFIEYWEDIEAIAQHNSTAHFKEWIAIKEDFVAQSEVIKYRQCDSL